MKLTRHLEEPIREIVPAIWQLPFVEDTRHCCSGHVVALNYDYDIQARRLTEKNIEEIWYPHRATLQIDYSLDEKLQAERDAFRDALKNVRAIAGNRTLYFNPDHEFLYESQDAFCRRTRNKAFNDPFPPREKEDILLGDYNADFERDGPKTIAYVEETEALLTAFWEGVAAVVREHNPDAKIGPIAGRNFRKTITWAEWKTVFPRMFGGNLEPEEPGIF